MLSLLPNVLLNSCLTYQEFGRNVACLNAACSRAPGVGIFESIPIILDICKRQPEHLLDAPAAVRMHLLAVLGDEVVNLDFHTAAQLGVKTSGGGIVDRLDTVGRSEEHTSELQSPS